MHHLKGNMFFCFVFLNDLNDADNCISISGECDITIVCLAEEIRVKLLNARTWKLI